ncbi:DSD1 family PLP-dependent enzyme [Hydrogenophaga taeniospiralis]|uniref:DSD1 family PLP-dependent enzyme n=1 Tax=Hydrogenophaga taeniospiralis TaxID=65656 RepID=UPI001CFBE25B|nr:DSD1 family PLP-dependent enzyme [Hydrogenophaga taeniospiralis]MCB4362138.1 DSD1 family PLP-dependent enzyme [Hydrogenophaga taeniospiralis]
MTKTFASLRWQRALDWVGHSVEAIDTPALVIDLDAMDRNLARMAAFAAERGLRLRPHAKLHKSAELARLQMAHGAVGVCVQKTDEALALAQGGVGDIFISNEVIAPAKLARLAQAVRELPTRFAIAVDSALGIARLATALAHAGVERPQAIDVFIEIDVGQGRCGLPPGEAALALARQIADHPALRFAGLQAYHGRAQHLRTLAERQRAIEGATQAVATTRDALASAGIAVPLVTGAGTGSFALEAASGVWDELQTGSYLFMDADYAANQPHPEAPVFEHALFVKTQVMSRSAHHAVCDAGHKSHAIDSGLPQVSFPGGLLYANGGDEHGLLRAEGDTPLPGLGETVWLIPGHCDPTVNLHDAMVGVRGGLAAGRVERIVRVDARGAAG